MVSRLAIVEPTTLLGEAVRENLESRPTEWENVELFTTDSEAIGALSEVAGRAALVQSLEGGEVLESFSAAIFCGEEVDPELLRSLPESCRCVFIDPDPPLEDIEPMVAGIGSCDPVGVSRIVSPAPVALLLSHLCAPLLPLGEIEITAHVLQPASTRGKAGIDELFEQTRGILTMQEQRKFEVFGAQLAFNLLPWRASARTVTAHLEKILGENVDARLHLSQAGVFHCCSAAISLQPAKDPGRDEIMDLLLENPLVERADDPELLGPVAASAGQKILISDLESQKGQGYWLWTCADNLLLSAQNALQLAEL